MHRLGPGYKNQFKFETEAGQSLREAAVAVLIALVRCFCVVGGDGVLLVMLVRCW